MERQHVRNATNRTPIAKQICIPASILRIDNPALRDSLISKKHPSLIGTKERIRAVDHLRPDSASRPDDVEQVVLASHLEQLGSLAHQPCLCPSRCRRVLNQHLIDSARLQATEVILQFLNPNLSDAVNQISLTAIKNQ